MAGKGRRRKRDASEPEGSEPKGAPAAPDDPDEPEERIFYSWSDVVSIKPFEEY